MKYIDADKLLAEIERKKKQLFEIGGDMFENKWACGSLDSIKEFVISFQQEQPGVDLEKEATNFVQSKEFIESEESPVLLIARHFYELGLNERKEE
jgi:hypothetical protein